VTCASVMTAGANGVVCIGHERCGVRDLAVVCVTAVRAACADGGACGRAYATVPSVCHSENPITAGCEPPPPSLCSARAGGGPQPPLPPPPHLLSSSGRAFCRALHHSSDILWQRGPLARRTMRDQKRPTFVGGRRLKGVENRGDRECNESHYPSRIKCSDISIVLQSSRLISYVANSTTQHFAIGQAPSGLVPLPYWPSENGSLLNKIKCTPSLSMFPKTS